MSYIGSPPASQFFAPGTDTFSGTGSQTAFTLSRNVATVNDILVVVNNVEQQPSNYTVLNNILTFSPAPSAGTNNIYVRYLSTNLQTIAPQQGSVYPSSLSTGGPTWDTSGNVNIGTTSLNSNLTVIGNGNFKSNNAYEAQVTVTGASAIAGAAPYYIFQRSKGTYTAPTTISVSDQIGTILYQGYDGTSYSNGASIGCISDAAVTTGNIKAALTFATGNNSERMRIDSSGNLCIGIASNILGGTGFKQAITYSTAGGIGMSNAAGNTGYYIAFYNTSGFGGGISQSGVTTSYTSGSDYRLKENVQPMVGALDTVAQLKPCTYKWKHDGSNGQGFIAHELQEIVPDCVVGEKDAVNEDGSIKVQSVDTSFLVATLTAAIQEQQAMIEELKTKVAALEAR